MKALIWCATYFTVAIIQTTLNMNGIYLGGIPVALLYGGAFAAAKALCRGVDRKRMVEDPDTYLKKAAPPARKVGTDEWACPVCGTVSREKEIVCIQCGLDQYTAKAWLLKHEQKKQEEYKPVVREPRPGDWTCPKCGNVHDKGISRCWKCGMLKQDAVR